MPDNKNVPELEEEQEPTENDKTTNLISEKPIEPVTENNDDSAQEPITKGIWNKTKNFLGNIAHTVKEKTTTLIEETRLNNEIENLFNNKCETFIIGELLKDKSFLSAFSKYKIKAIRNAEPNTIYVKEKESLFNKLKSGMTLVAESDNASFKILEKDAFTLIDYPIQLGETTYTIKCYRLKVKFVENESPTSLQNITTINQSIVVHGNNEGSINQIANIDEQLSQIENAINNCKPSLLQHSKKKDAQVLFGNFKECILTKKEDLSLFEKFKKVLRALALDVAVSLVTALITQTFN